jgi:hypothetical protein
MQVAIIAVKDLNDFHWFKIEQFRDSLELHRIRPPFLGILSGNKKLPKNGLIRCNYPILKEQY